jgi:hypothetical protein
MFVLYASKVQLFRTLECASDAAFVSFKCVRRDVCSCRFFSFPGLLSFAQVDTWLGPEADPDLYKTRQQPQNYMQQNLQYVRQMQASLASQVGVSSRASSKTTT